MIETPNETGTFKLTPAQSLALDASADTCIMAGAGSGKTRTLVEKIYAIINSHYDSSSGADVSILSRILCITFTNKAASELCERILKKLREQHAKAGTAELKDYLERVSDNLGELRISTLDSFFSSIVKTFPIQAGVRHDFSACTEGVSKVLFYDAVKDAIEKLSNLNDGSFASHAIDEFYALYKSAFKIFELYYQLLSKSVYLKRPLFQFNSEAEFESHLLQRIESLDATLCDARCESILSYGGFLDSMDYLALIKDELKGASAVKCSELVSAYSKINDKASRDIFFGYLVNEYKRVIYGKLAGESLEKTKACIAFIKKAVEPFYTAEIKNGYAKRLTGFEFRFYKGLCDIFDEARNSYDEIKKIDGMLDFGDIETAAWRALNDKRVSEILSKTYSHILIDEFQDTNDRQAAIISLIKGGARLSIVGDGMQSIYRFRNANCKLFSKFESEIKLNGGNKIELSDNFRSSAKILEFINGFFSSFEKVSNEAFSDFTYSGLRAAAKTATDFETACEFGFFATTRDKSQEITSQQDDASPAAAAVDESRDDEFNCDQYEFISRRIESLVNEKKCEYGDVMILLSRMTHADELTRALKRRDVPYIVYKSRNLYERPEILDVYNLVKALANPYDNIALTGALRSPMFSMADYKLFIIMEKFAAIKNESGNENSYLFEALSSYSSGVFDFNDALREPITAGEYSQERKKITGAFERFNSYLKLSETLNTYELLSYIFDELMLYQKYEKAGNAAACGNLKKLLSHILEGSYLPDAPVYKFALDFEKVVEMQFSEEESQTLVNAGDSVKIMTVHQSKGLEEKIVIIPELEAKFFRHNDIIISETGDMAFHPRPIAGLSPMSLSEKYFKSVKNHENFQEMLEKKRLLYVAMTRAKQLLILTGSFNISIAKSGEISCSALDAQPLVFGGSWLNWFANYLKINAAFFTSPESNKDFPLKLSAPGGGEYLLWTSAPNDIKTSIPIIHGIKAREEKNKEYPQMLIGGAIEQKIAVKPVITYTMLEKYIKSEEEFAKEYLSSPQQPSQYFPPEIKGNINHEALTGSAIHRAIELIIKSAEPIEKFAVQKKAFNSLVLRSINAPREFHNTISKKIEFFLHSLLSSIDKSDLLSEIFNNYNRKNLYSEVEVSFETDEYIMKGKCDLLVIEENGLTHIYDFKTINDLNRASYKKLDYEKQLAFYGICAQNSIYEIKSLAQAAIVLIETGEHIKFKELVIELPEKKIIDYINKKCGELYQKIKAAAFNA